MYFNEFHLIKIGGVLIQNFFSVKPRRTYFIIRLVSLYTRTREVV